MLHRVVVHTSNFGECQLVNPGIHYSRETAESGARVSIRYISRYSE